ncbi:MAG: NfeD family protein [Methanobacteriaceae archaeon]|nr:NfeD family protein [Methanobacteriaceae archaeon]
MISFEFWIILAIIAIILEILSLSFFLISIGMGFIAAGILNYYNYNSIEQITIFAIVTIICILLSRPLANKLTKNKSNRKSNTQRLINKKGIVIKTITPNKSGLIKVYGETWKAISDEEINTDEEVIIKKISGVKLIVEKKIK